MTNKNLNKRRFKYGMRAFLLTTLVVVVSVGLYALLERKHWRIDFTEKKEFSFAPQTQDTLKNLEEVVTIKAFFGPGEDLDDVYIRRRVDDVLREYAAHSPKIHYQMVDPSQDVTQATQFQVHTDGTIVFQSGKNRKDVFKSQLFDFSEMTDSTLPLFTGEGLFTNTILKVLNPIQKTICFLEGHGERIYQDNEASGLSQFKIELSNGNYESETVSFIKNREVPTRCSLLVIPGPTRPVTSPEDTIIQEWMKKGGKSLILVEPLTDNPLPQTLREIEVMPENDLVFDPDRHFITGPHYPAPVLLPHPITKGIQGVNPILFSARSLVSEEGTELLATSPQAWGETDLRSGAKPEFQEGSDKKGPLILGYAIEKKENNAAETQKTSGTPWAVVVGDVDFATNSLIHAPGNLDLVMNMVGWLVGDKDQVSIRPKTPDYRNISLTSGKAKFISYFTQLIYPLMVLFGIGSYWYRRRNR